MVLLVKGNLRGVLENNFFIGDEAVGFKRTPVINELSLYDGIIGEHTLTQLVTGSEHSHVLRDRSKCYLWDDFIGRQIDDRVWETNVSGAGSVISIPIGEVLGGLLRIRSGGGVDRFAELYFGSRFNFSVAKNAWTAFRLRVEDNANTYVNLAFLGASYQIRFTKWQLENWYSRSSDSGGETATDTGVASDSSWHEFTIECLPGQVKFYIDGSLKATHTTNIPSEAFELSFRIETTGGAAAQDMWLDYVEAAGDRA